MISFQTERPDGSYMHQCGGTLLRSKYLFSQPKLLEPSDQSRFVLTAAHCARPVKDFEFKLIFTNGQEMILDGSTIEIHPDYNILTQEDDIAIISIPPEYVNKVKTIRPAIIPASESLNNPPAYHDAVEIGYGSPTLSINPSYPTLNKLELPIAPAQVCELQSHKSYGTPYLDKQSRLCVQGDADHGMGIGDSGSALVVAAKVSSPTVVGVASSSFPKPTDNTLISGIAVYTRVSSYVGWIQSVVNPYELKSCPN